MDKTTKDFANYICECGKEFQCYHESHRGDIWMNHCFKCGKGAGYDMCKGVCPDCFKKETEKLEKSFREEFKIYAEHMLE